MIAGTALLVIIAQSQGVTHPSAFAILDITVLLDRQVAWKFLVLLVHIALVETGNHLFAKKAPSSLTVPGHPILIVFRALKVRSITTEMYPVPIFILVIYCCGL